MAIRYGQTVDLGNNKIIDVADPTMTTDAATKGYVDSIAVGLFWRDPVRVAADTNINIASPGPIDGVTLVDTNRVLLMNQSDPVANGLYVFGGGVLTRAPDNQKPGVAVNVTEGTAYHDQAFNMSGDDPFTLGSSPQTWTVFNAGGVPVYNEGDGIDVTNYRISAVPALNGGIGVTAGGIGVVGDTNAGITVGVTGVGVVTNPAGGLAVDATGVRVVPATNKGLAVDATGVAVLPDPDGALALSATGLAVVPAADSGIDVSAAGVAVILDPAGGLLVDATGVKLIVAADTGLQVDGSGLATVLDPAGALHAGPAGLGVTPATAGGLTVDATGAKVVTDGAAGVPAGVTILRKFTGVVGDGSATTIRVNHGLGTKAVGVELIAASSPWDTVTPEVQRPDTDNVDLVFGHAPSSGAYTVVVWG